MKICMYIEKCEMMRYMKKLLEAYSKKCNNNNIPQKY